MIKMTKKIFALILTFCMTLSLVAVANAANVYDFTLTTPRELAVGETCGVMIETKAPGLCRTTYSTSDESIAVVDNMGYITGVSEGEATITVTIKFEDGSVVTKTSVTKVVTEKTNAETDTEGIGSFIEKLTAFFNMIIQLFQNLFN